jgi:GH18 family chitinase
MLAFTKTAIPKIMESVDFLNIMTYDLFNRRDNFTKHHTGVQNSLEGINAYLERGVPPARANLGLAYYIKWYKTAIGVDCHAKSVGCPTELMEDPATGADLGKTGAFSWHDQVPDELKVSFHKALSQGTYDEHGGGLYYWDKDERLFWSWDDPKALAKKIPDILGAKELGGVFAWALGEDAPRFDHLRASTAALRDFSVGASKSVPKERVEL